MEQIMEKVKKTKILGGVGVIALFLGTILPYLKFSLWGYSKSISLFDYWEGKVIILLAIANALFIFKEFIKTYVPQFFNSPFGKMVENANEKMSLIPTIAAALFAIYLYIDLDVDSSFVKYGIGFWVVWIGVVALIAHAILYKGTDAATAPAQPGINPVTPQPQMPMDQVSATTPVMQQPVEQPTPVAPAMPEQPVQPATPKFCANCGNQVDPATNTCTACGTQQ